VIWGGAEYLLWWVRNQPVATPLVTTGTPASMGALGAPGTVVLFGGSDIDYHTFSGGRFTLGLGWGSSCDGALGVEGSGFFLEKRIANMVATSSVTGVPILARPFQNALDATESEALVSFPGAARGSVVVSSGTSLYGWDVDLAAAGYRDGDWKLGLLGGFRYLNLTEDLNIGQVSSLLPGGTAGFGFGNALVPPTTVTIVDHFGTRNEFYGGQLGARVEYGGDHFFVSVLSKVALGSVHEVVDLAGFTSGTGPGTVAGTTPGGLLVVSSNAGRRAHDEFAVVPEFGINVGYQVCRAFRVFVGYSFLYVSDVVRPGDQINRVVNPALIPASTSFGKGTGPAEPTFSFQRTDFWAQGVNFGLEFRF
jgi:hypothetical protein